MPKFCTACGTRNDLEAGFCEECGTPLRPLTVSPGASIAGADQPLSAGVIPTTVRALKPWMMPVGAGAVILIALVGAFAWWSSPPPPGADAFASALRGTTGAAAAPSVELLCLNNVPYNRDQINVQPYDSTTRRWMETLVSAGLYAPGQPVQSGYQQAIQYRATQELGKWRKGARLCLGKSWSLAEVKGDRFTADQRGGHALYRASALWKAEGTPPWVERISDSAGQTPGLSIRGGSVSTQSTHVFELRDRHWVVLTNSDLGRVQRDVLQARVQPASRSSAPQANQGGVVAAVTGLFSGFGSAHPLVGEWAVDASTPLGGLLGAALPFKNGRILFGKDYMESGGDRVKAQFDVSGDLVTVRAEGESDGFQFRMNGKDRAVMTVGFAEIPFTRVK
jgi:hypothetical protein